MGEITRADEFPESEEPHVPAGYGTQCPDCQGRGRKFVTLRRLVGAGGGASEDELLKRTTTDCLRCSGTGRAPA